MKRNFVSDDDRILSTSKKLKFGVDSILGNANLDSVNKFSFEMDPNIEGESTQRNVRFKSPDSLNELSSFQPNLLKMPYADYLATQNNIDFREYSTNHSINTNHTYNTSFQTNPMWPPTIRPCFGNYSMPGNDLYLPTTSQSIFWPLDFQNKIRPRMLRRAVFTEQQRKGLETAFVKQKYINKSERKKLAQRLSLKDSQVKIWFQNRRMKWRNTKDRETIMSKNSNHNHGQDRYHLQEDGIVTYSPSSTDETNELKDE